MGNAAWLPCALEVRLRGPWRPLEALGGPFVSSSAHLWLGCRPVVHLTRNFANHACSYPQPQLLAFALPSTPPWPVQTPQRPHPNIKFSPLCAKGPALLQAPAQSATLQTGRLMDVAGRAAWGSAKSKSGGGVRRAACGVIVERATVDQPSKQPASGCLRVRRREASASPNCRCSVAYASPSSAHWKPFMLR